MRWGRAGCGARVISAISDNVLGDCSLATARAERTFARRSERSAS